MNFASGIEALPSPNASVKQAASPLGQNGSVSLMFAGAKGKEKVRR